MTGEVTNPAGRRFTVRIVARGDRYGLEDCMTHDEIEPLVEFYDDSVQFPTFDARGQFVSRYYLSTLIYHLIDHPGQGLDLQGDVDEWWVSFSNVQDAIRLGLSIWKYREGVQ